MLVPILASVGSAGIGTLLAFAPVRRAGVLRGLQFLALAVAAAVVFGHLLPEAFAEIGAMAIVVTAAAALGPRTLELGVSRFGATGSRGGLALELSYAGLLVHRVTDGIGLWAYSSELHGGLDVIVALVLHEIPVTLVMVLAFLTTRGRTVALVRAAGLALFGVIGTILATFVPLHIVERGEPWLAAILSGLLLDVIVHLAVSARRGMKQRPASAGNGA